MNQFDFTDDEKIIAEALKDARKVQEYLWQELSLSNNKHFDMETWGHVFYKRVVKIIEIKDPTKAHGKVELRKRLLQQAALSICAIRLLDSFKHEPATIPNGDPVAGRDLPQVNSHQ